MSRIGNFRNLMLGAVAVMPFLVLTNTQASALVAADAVLEITDFKFVDENGNNWSSDEIVVQTATNSADILADLDSVGGAVTDSGDNSVTPPTDNNGDVKLTGNGQGTSPIADDDYTPLAPVPNTNHFAYADADVVGISIDVPNPSPPPANLVDAGVNAQTRATSSLTSTDAGSAQSNTNLVATFQFEAAASGELWVSFDFFVSLIAYVDPLATAPSSAIARANWEITIEDNFGNENSLQLSDFITDNGQESRTDASPTPLDSFSQSGSVLEFLIDLVDGRIYDVSITHSTTADTTLTVPEPGTLMLIGGGLLMLAGFGYGTRRREAA